MSRRRATPTPGRRRLAAGAAALGAALALAGCGFQLRGSAALPFGKLHAFFGGSSLAGEFRRTLQARGGTRLVDDPKAADAVIEILSENRDKDILSFSGVGRPVEYRLRYRVGFRVYAPDGREFIAPSSIELSRDITAPEATLGGTLAEETLMYRDMTTDMINQILRRLAAIRV